MRAFWILILFFCFADISIGQKDYPDSGFTNKAEAKNLVVNGLKEGKWVNYNISTFYGGGVRDTFGYTLSIYKGGLIYGIVRGFFKSGQLSYVVPYINGKRNGVEKGYYKSGKIMFVRPNTNDRLDGIEKDYGYNIRVGTQMLITF